MQETAERQTVADFVKAHGVTLAAEHWHENPNMDGSGQMDNWRCRLRCDGRSMQFYFSKGYAHDGKRPELANVLDCLASEAADVAAARSFEDWAEDLGYSEDSRKAERIFKTCEKTAESLCRVLGDDAYQDLLWNTKRE